ncbi:HNH endonuclease [Truepera radiovictrix]|uniref:HNH endonuclease n=1 Tax=Truepera radiovictrix (strain DSM 17093 / CIP 108686 / LMG 22925 / RQ-24) TaxID=649638 RepID=D7CXM7_TRURR|nr:HNH endonuclease [Truepera radiovictrix]ADI14629.1 HNH endonuclease [Truepera radiovictrix DSM 17093]WMT56821.1 HNH endonuclease [Truepera radiovictrix]
MLNFDDAEAHLEARPAADVFRALSQLRLTENDLKLLRAHYAAPRMTVTAKEMARRTGYKHFGAANLHYGKLGRRLADALGLALEYPVQSLVTMAWPTGECAWTLRPQVQEALEQLGLVAAAEPQQDPEEEQWLREGKLVRTLTNAYERNPEARRRCLEHYGTACYICGFSFGEVYGEAFRGVIHVHHLTELSQIGEEYVVDPLTDLRPVCPNCHAIIHQRKPAYSLEEVKALLARRRKA